MTETSDKKEQATLDKTKMNLEYLLFNIFTFLNYIQYVSDTQTFIIRVRLLY